MSLGRFCRRPVSTVSPADTVLAAARRMKTDHVGAVVVVDEVGRPVGMLTDRDIACRVVAERLDSAQMRVDEVMTPNPAVVRKSDLIDEAAFRMREAGVRRLPVVGEDGKVEGLVALDDLMVMLSAELGQTAQVVRENRGP